MRAITPLGRIKPLKGGWLSQVAWRVIEPPSCQGEQVCRLQDVRIRRVILGYIVKAASRQVTAEVVLKHSGHREYLADICELLWLREHVNVVRAKWVQRPSSTTQVSFFSSPSVAKSKPPTAQEPCIQRRQREEEEKYAHLPSELINHGNMTSVLQGVRFSP